MAFIHVQNFTKYDNSQKKSAASSCM